MIGGGATYGAYRLNSMQEPEDAQVSEEGVVAGNDAGESTESDELAAAYKAYAEVYKQIEDEYGEYQEFEYYDIYYAGGIFYSDLLDFTKDGIPELVIAYGTQSDDNPDYGIFEVSIWSFINESCDRIYYSYSLPFKQGDFSSSGFKIATRNDSKYIVTRESGAPTDMKFLEWDGTGFTPVMTFIDDLAEGGENILINGDTVSATEYNATMEEWLSSSETYNPYLMANGWEPEPGEKNKEETLSMIDETKAEIGLDSSVDNNSSRNDDDDIQTAQVSYTTIINTYNDIINGNMSINDASINLSASGLYSAPDGVSYIDEDGYFHMEDSEYSDSEYQYYYLTLDVNNDGIDELLIAETSPSYYELYGESRFFIIDIYTLHNNEIIWLAAGLYRSNIEICENGTLVNIASGGAQLTGYTYYELTNGALQEIHTATEDWGNYYIDDDPCTQSEFNDFLSNYETIGRCEFFSVNSDLL